MALVVGVYERDGGSLYNTQLVFDTDGTLLLKRRKITPTYRERMVWGQGDGSGIRTVDSAVGRIGALACWEHYNPLARFALMADGEEIHCAQFPGSMVGQIFADQIDVTIRHHALEAGCFVINSMGWLTDEQIRAIKECYSPSTVVRDYFTAGEKMAVSEFLTRSRKPLAEASERVRAKYGFACSSAASQLADIEINHTRFSRRRHRPHRQHMKTHFPVIVVGGGQAGLSISYCLKQRGIEHLVFERNQLAESWRSKRWDSFCLVTPNWQCQLPGFPYPGNDPHGFMVKEEIVAYIEAYARSFSPPLHEGITVKRLARAAGGGFLLETTFRDFTAEQVTIATGGYHTATIPRIAERFSPEMVQFHSSEYKSASGLPPGEVLVVGTGQSGCQIAEDLHLAGRRVHLCVDGAPRTARRYRGKDVVDWLADLGYYDMPVPEHPLKERVRAKANH